jgi:periplasmic divalent cation tolerance protein
MQPALISITYPSEDTAKLAAERFIKKKLMVCVNYFPVVSTYLWRGKTEGAEEYLLIGKTVSSFFQNIVDLVEKEHPYEDPVVEMWPVIVNSKSVEWINNELNLEKEVR